MRLRRLCRWHVHDQRSRAQRLDHLQRASEHCAAEYAHIRCVPSRRRRHRQMFFLPGAGGWGADGGLIFGSRGGVPARRWLRQRGGAEADLVMVNLDLLRRAARKCNRVQRHDGTRGVVTYSDAECTPFRPPSSWAAQREKNQ